MTEEPPVPPGRRPRPDPDFRRQALNRPGVDPVAFPGGGGMPIEAPTGPQRAPAAPARASLREELARIPDLTREHESASTDGDRAPEPVLGATSEAGPVPVSAEAPAAALVAAPAAVPVLQPKPPRTAPVRGRGSSPPPRAASRLARAAFACALLLLVVAVPVLGAAGYRLVAESTGGRFAGRAPTPREPGYEAAVEPTPTALVVQHDAEGVPVGATFLSLSGADGGGSMIFVPLETAIRKPALGIDRLSEAYETFADRPAEGRKVLATQVSHLLNVGLGETIEVDDQAWAQLTAPVGTISFDNPDEVEVGGATLSAGPVTLAPLQVGPYLAATVEGESDLNRINRQQVFWQAWLEAISAKGVATGVAGETGSGLGLFARTLASGAVTSDVLPVNQDDIDPTLLRMDPGAANTMVTAAVPAPVSAYLGSRRSVRLLNGVSADAIPPAVLSKVVSLNGEITIVGNGPSFGQDRTSIVYSDPAQRDYARMLRAALGGTAKLRLDREAPDTLDVTVVLGRDVLDQTSSIASGSTTTAPGFTDPTAVTSTSEGF